MKTPEALPLSDYMHGDEAIKVFNAYRDHPEIDDHSRVENIEVEFPWLAESLGGAAVYLARFDENKAGTFKVRGMAVGMEAMLKTDKAVQTYSAGNAGKAVAILGKVNDVPTRVVVPRSAPPQKREGIRQVWRGGLLVVQEAGETYDEAREWALAHPDGYGELPPYDDPNVIAGQGTMLDDIVEELGEIDHVVMTTGGAGGIAGMLKRSHELDLHTKFHVVEAEGSNSLSKSMAAGEATRADAPNQNFGGSAVGKVGSYTLAVCLAHHDLFELYSASDREMEGFIDTYEEHRRSALLEDHTQAYEPTSLVPMVKLADIALRYPGETIVALGTGHNDSLRRHDTPPPRSHIASGSFPR